MKVDSIYLLYAFFGGFTLAILIAINSQRDNAVKVERKVSNAPEWPAYRVLPHCTPSRTFVGKGYMWQTADVPVRKLTDEELKTMREVYNELKTMREVYNLDTYEQLGPPNIEENE